MIDEYQNCDNCYYEFSVPLAYPCSMCIRGYERTDQWKPKRDDPKPKSLLEAMAKFRSEEKERNDANGE